MQPLKALCSAFIVVMLEQQQLDGRFMATDKTHREKLNELARELGGKLVHIECYALKCGDDTVILDSDLNKVHGQLLTLRMEKENASN